MPPHFAGLVMLWHALAAPRGCAADVSSSRGLRVTAESAVRLNQTAEDERLHSELDSLLAEREDLRAKEDNTTSKIDGLVAAVSTLATEIEDLRAKENDLTSKEERITAKIRGAQHDLSGHPETSGEDSSREWPCRVFASCGTLILFAYMYFANGLWTSTGRSYTLLDMVEKGSTYTAAVIAYVAYWLVMLWALFLLSLGSTCEGGAPLNAYAAYSGFAAIHFGCGVITCVGWRDKLPGSFALAAAVAFTALEHFDMASDVLFLGTATACSANVDSQWLASWGQVPLIGRFLEPAFAKFGFDGFSVTIFVTGAYLPQLLSIPSLFTPFFMLLTLTLVALWVIGGCLGGCAAAIVLAAFALIQAKISGLVGETTFEILERVSLWDGECIAYASGLLMFELEDKKEMARNNFFHGMTKVVFENLLQLGVQISFIGLSFDLTDDAAKAKAMASVVVALGVSAAKVANMSRNFPCRGHLMLSPVYFLIIWLVAKLVMTVRCESHVWNVTSGCAVV